MREIKFRAYIKAVRQMAEATIIIFKSGADVIRIYDDAASEDVWFKSDEVVLMQYTGLKDKNGVEIYEGDVLSFASERFLYGVYAEENHIEKVEFNEGCYWLGGYPLFEVVANDDEACVVGNDYENPELMEVRK